MAVIVKYVVERQGEEVMTFSSKAEADAYDKMLDLAESLVGFLELPGCLSDEQIEQLSLHMAQNKEQLQTLLKGKKAVRAPGKAPKAVEAA
ncbi:YebG family protein [Ferrimonas pelagia]|uniref:YebG family protein n=1 Tax=Ferrimonas pelagia TaxID=1177826 RepID=A0ABP9F3N7_9GAMM